jgi:hypothetical protein
MNELIFDFEWVAARDTGIPEHDATWANFGIFVDGTAVTRVFDERLNSVRSRLMIPLYPLAEWLAANWWCLHVEVRRAHRSKNATYDRRHNFKFAREGYALPDLLVEPQGKYVAIQWSKLDSAHYDIQFISSGEAHVASSVVSSEIQRLLDAVEERLSSRGVRQTPFQEDWQAIKQADEDEEAFCRAAARLGCDPYSLNVDQQDEIIGAYEVIPDELHSEFYETADIEELEAQAHLLSREIGETRQAAGPARLLQSLRDDIAPTHGEFPWEIGYSYARRTRTYLGLEDRPLGSLDDLIEVFSSSGDQALSRHRQVSDASYNLFDALVASENGDAGFSIKRGRESSQKFTLCRSIFQYLTAPNRDAYLVTRALSEAQRRNRAFAAEFLAPSTALRKSVSSNIIDEEEIENIAYYFGVSTYVIEHQINNHDIVDSII